MHRLTTFFWNPGTQAFDQKSTDRALGVNDVLIKTTHSGLCYTDVHAKSKGCGLGHEGVGLIEKVGDAVTHLSVGERVGWGWLHSVSDMPNTSMKAIADGGCSHAATARLA